MKIAVCDDESIMCEQLGEFIKRYCRERDLPFELKTYTSGEDLLKETDNNFDVIFLDIDMGEGMNGMETAKNIRKENAGVILVFVTALYQYAVEGYKVRAYRYLIKPINYERFTEELKGIEKEFLESRQKFIEVKCNNTVISLPVGEIEYIEIFERTLIYHTKEDALEVNCTLREITEKLNQDIFALPHRSYLVNLGKIKKRTNDEITVNNGDRIPISKYRRKEFMEKYFNFWGERLL